MIKARNLHKRFVIPHERRGTLLDKILAFFDDGKSDEVFYALENISFQARKGDFIGVIGPNGSGKSTLLRLISKIMVPTKGNILVDGKVVSLLDLSIGFQEELTARENIYLYGAIMGLSRKDIKENFNEIVEFAGIERFVDAKIKTFSTGMKVRIAFSTAIKSRADIFVLDEVLAVGDKEFQKKCFNVFTKMKKDKKTIIFASHDLSAVDKFCNKCLLLKQGRQIGFADTKSILNIYRADNER